MKRVLIPIVLLLVSCSKEPTPYEQFEMETTRVQGKKLQKTAESRDEHLDTLRTDLPGPDAANAAPQEVSPKDSIGVELLWKVPTDEVLAYHFYYGTKQNELSQHIRVPIGRLEQLAHPVYGAVFRYRLQGAFPEEEIFVSIRAENENGLSPESREIRIPVNHAVGVDTKGIDVRDQQRRY